MKKIALIWLQFLIACTTYAQSIRIIDSAQKAPVPGAVIIAYDPATQKTVQGATNADGYFSVTYSADHPLQFSVSAMGYKKALVKQTQKDQSILLSPDSRQLKEVAIKAASSPVKFNGNIMEYDISQVPNADYLNLSDIIDHLPFLQVTKEGSIKMMDETLTILIDNRPNAVYNDARALIALPPQAIDKIEVVLTPTARNGGKTLNITLKRDYFLGWNGSVNVSGSGANFTPTGSVSYWRKKYGFDASVNYNYSVNNTTANTTVHYIQEQSTLTEDEQARTHLNSGGISFSAYYNLDDYNSIDMQLRLAPSKNDGLTNSTILMQSASVLDNDFSNINRHTSSLADVISLNYTHKYHKAGNVFYLLSNFTGVASNGNQLLVNSFNNGADLSNTLSVNNTNNPSVTVEALQQNNFNKKISYSFGSKLIIRNNKNNHSLDENNVLAITPVNMQQIVSSSYIDADFTFKKLTAHTGLRFDYNTNNFTEPVVLEQSFANVTPTVSLTYNVNPINLLMFTYGRRIIRPGFYATAPVTNPVNTYEEKTGTANLQNQVSNDWGLQYYGNYKAVRIGFNLRYGRLRGVISNISDLDSANIIQTRSTNINLYESYTVGFSADINFLKKLRFSHFNNLSYAIQRSGIYDNHTWGVYLSDRLSYQMNKQNSFDFSIFGHTPNIDLQGVDQQYAFFNWGISYGHYFDLLKNYPTAIGLSISNPTLYNGLPGYSTVNAIDFTKRQDTKISNPVIGINIRVQIKGKQSGNRTFNKAKSIQNNDLSTP